MKAESGKRNLQILCVMLALLCFGCASRAPRILEHPKPIASELIHQINENRNRLKDFSASGIIRVRGGEIQSAAFGMTMAYLPPDFLKVVFFGPFGVTLGKIVLMNNAYEVDFGEQYYGEGLLDDLQLLRFIPSDFSGSDLLQLFLPLAPCDFGSDSVLLTTDAEAHQYLLTTAGEQSTNYFWVHPEHPVISEELILDAKGDTISRRESRAIKQQRGVYFPTEWVVQLGKDGNTITCELELSKYHINSGLIPADFAFSRRIQPEFDSTEVELER